jgi:hypothetical protein
MDPLRTMTVSGPRTAATSALAHVDASSSDATINSFRISRTLARRAALLSLAGGFTRPRYVALAGIAEHAATASAGHLSPRTRSWE